MNNNKLIIVIGLIILLLLTFLLAKMYVDKVNAEEQLREAKKPSLIEKQYTELKTLEKTWQELEKSCQKKPDVEEKIQNKRKEILWISKK